MLLIRNTSRQAVVVTLNDLSYKTGNKVIKVAAESTVNYLVDLTKSYNWYDFSISVAGKKQYIERYAGRVETGRVGKTDPLMGGVV